MADNNDHNTPPQSQPGSEARMQDKPKSEFEDYIGSGLLKGKVAIVTGGDSGIGRAVSILFAKEGADVAVVYLSEDKDAQDTKAAIESLGRHCLLISGDVGDESFCQEAVQETLDSFEKLDILINNAAEQHLQEEFEKITEEQLEKTFRTNIFGYFFMTKAALPHLKRGASIINTTSVTAYKGNPKLIDYSATKGAIVAFTRSLSQSLAPKGIRVNAVAPGPIWTPLIVSTFSKDQLTKFGKDTQLGRAGQPEEVALSYLFLAMDRNSYMTGQVLHPNGGEIING